MSNDVADLLRQIAEEVRPRGPLPAHVLRAARRRIARSVGAALVVAAVVTVGSVVGVNAVRDAEGPDTSVVPAGPSPAPGGRGSFDPGVVMQALGDVGPSLRADDRIAFFSDRQNGQLWELFVMGLQGENPRRLTDLPLRLEGASRISWGPGGETLVFDVGLGEGHGAIDVIDLRSGERTRVIEDRTGNNPQAPAVSPDGDAIAFNDANGDLWIVGIDGSDLRPLTTSLPLTAHLSPAWSPSGDVIAFECDCGERSGIYVVRSTGGLPRMLHGGPASRPVWSPDAEMIAFSREGRIHVIDADGTDPRSLTSGVEDFAPSWVTAPLFALVFESNRDGNAEIYYVDPGGGERRLTNDPASDFAPAWRPPTY